MFFDYPVYNAALESENRLVNIGQVEQIMPHADVPVDPGAVSTPCAEFFFFSGTAAIVLLEYEVIKAGLFAYKGIVDQTGALL